MLLTNKAGMLIVAGNALGFFTGSGNVFPFSVDVFGFCRSFRGERNTAIKTYISPRVLLVNEVYNVIKKNSLFDSRTTIRYKIIFRTQNRMNCKLCRIIRREYRFFYLYIVSCKGKSYSISTEVELWNLIVGRYCWEISPAVGYFGSWKKEVAAVEETFWRMNFQSSRLLLLYNLNHFISALYGQSFLFWSKRQRFPFMGGVSVFKDLVQILTLFCFSVFCSV